MPLSRVAESAATRSIDGSAIAPVITWGINPGQSVGVGERIPNPDSAPEDERATYREALALGGTTTLPEIYRTAGVKLIFDAEGMRQLVGLVEQRIAELRGAGG